MIHHKIHYPYNKLLSEDDYIDGGGAFAFGPLIILLALFFYCIIPSFNLADKDAAMNSIDSVDQAIDKVSGQRAKLGAIQSRLQSTINNLEIQTINQDNARSVIQDVDVAKATANLASTAVLKSAGIATLGQANSTPNSALRLIG